MTIKSKAATPEYRDNWDRIFAKKKEPKVCSNCAVDGQKCECEEAVCHVPRDASPEDCLKSLMAGVDMMQLADE